MAHINRKYIDKHWMVFIVRGALATIFGCLALFGVIYDMPNIIAIMSIFLLIMGIVDATGALYCSAKKHGWINSVIDALVDVVAAVLLLFFAHNDIIMSLLVITIYTIVSGLIDIFHGFLSTVDPTDRFIRVVSGVCGCVTGIVILNAGRFEFFTFIRFFGAYMLVVGITSLIYGIHNRSQDIEDKIARKQAARKITKKAKTIKKKATKKK